MGPSELNSNVILLILFFIVAVLLYFLPSMVAKRRNHRSRGSILIVNIFLGWTFIGWVVALAWACGGNTETNAVLVKTSLQ